MKTLLSNKSQKSSNLNYQTALKFSKRFEKNNPIQEDTYKTELQQLSQIISNPTLGIVSLQLPSLIRPTRPVLLLTELFRLYLQELYGDLWSENRTILDTSTLTAYWHKNRRRRTLRTSLLRLMLLGSVLASDAGQTSMGMVGQWWRVLSQSIVLAPIAPNTSPKDYPITSFGVIGIKERRKLNENHRQENLQDSTLD